MRPRLSGPCARGARCRPDPGRRRRTRPARGGLRRRGPSSCHGPFGPSMIRVMGQEIRFVHVDGQRVAYATIGEGPLLVFSARWITHLEDEWELPEVRRFFETFAQDYRVVRYDRIG